MKPTARQLPKKNLREDAERDALEAAYEDSLVDDRHASRVLRMWVLWMLVALGILGIVSQLMKKDINHDEARIEGS